MSEQARRRALVIGGGITGMSAALMLAMAGMEVSLVEKQARPGPLLRGFVRQGMHFETGFHFAGGLEPGGILRAWLKVLELDLPWERLRAGTEIVCLADRRYTMPSGTDNILRWTQETFPGSLAGMQRLLQELAEKLGESPYTSPTQTQPKPFLLTEHQETVTEHLNALSLDEDLKTILKARCLLYGVAPAKALWADYALVAGPYMQAGSTFEGGGLVFCQAFEQALARQGVHLVCGRAATRLLVAPGEGRRPVCGAMLEDGEVLEAESILFTGSPVQLADLLPAGSVRPAWRRHIASLQDTPFPMILYGIADASLPACTCWYKGPCDTELRSLEQGNATINIMTGTALEDGSKSCLVTGIHKTRLCREDPDYPRTRASLAQALIREAQSLVPELAGHWRMVTASTAATMRHWLHGSTGSIYGCQHSTDNLPLAPATRLPGLFLAGQNILLPGMLGCIISAAIAAELIAGTSFLTDRFRQCAHETS